MSKANMRGFKRLAVSLVLVSGFAGLGLSATDVLGRAAAQERTANTSAKAAEANELMRQAREAMNAKNYGKAKELAQQAQALRAPSAFYDETPEDLLAEVAKKPGMAGAGAKAPVKPTTTDPKILMSMALQAFEAGDLDKAQDLATQARAYRGSVRWGLFDDTPESLLKDIEKAKGRRDRDVSEKMLAEARELIEKRAATPGERAGNLIVAEEKAKQASKMHGPYSMWDFSDRPEDVVGEVKKLRDKEKLLNVQPEGQAFAQFRPVRTGSMDLIDPRDARPAKNDANTYRPRPTTPSGDDPAGRKKAAIVLMQEANALKQGGNFAEARMKLVEASKKNAWFNKNEDSPEDMLADLIGQAKRRIDTLTSEARTHMARKDSTAAIVKLDEAHQLAVVMGLDATVVMEMRANVRATTKTTPDIVVHNNTPGLKPVVDTSDEPPVPPIKTMPPVIKNGTGPSDLVLPPTIKEPAPVVKEPTIKEPVVKEPTVPTVKEPVVKEPVVKEPLLKDPPIDVAPPKIEAPIIKNGTGEPAKLPNDPPIKVDPPKIEAPIIKNGTPSEELKPVPKPVVDKGAQLLDQAHLALKSGDTNTTIKLTEEVIALYPKHAEAAAGLLATARAEEHMQKKLAAARTMERGMEALNAGNAAAALALFKQIDDSLLPAAKRPQLAQLLAAAQAKMKPDNVASENGGQLPRTAPVENLNPMPPKIGADSLLKQQEALGQVEFQKLRSEALKVESAATARFGRGETDAALQDMQNFVAKVKMTNLDSSKQALLTRPIEARMDRLRILKHQTDFLTKEAKDRRDFHAGMAQEALAKQSTQTQVASLMKSANKLMDEAKYKEAYAQIQKASQLEPDDMNVQAALRMADMMYRKSEFNRIKSTQEKTNFELGNELYDIGRVTGKDPLVHTDDPELMKRYKERTRMTGVSVPRTRSEKEREIERKLNSSHVDLSFKGTALEEVISHLSTNTNINFDLDLRSLKDENIDPKLPITVTLKDMTLKSALNIVCKQAGLKHMVDNEAIRVTTMKGGRARNEMRSLSVGDLVVPIANYGTKDSDFSRERLLSMGRGGNSGVSGGTPAGMPRLTGGNSVGENSMSSTGGGRLTNSQGGVSVTGPNATLDKELIRLITTTVRPDSWQALGGDGTIEYFPIGMALVINQSPEVIEEVERLLESLRKLQDLEVTIELKVVSLSETFYERIGVDFSMGIRTNGSTTDPRGLASPPQAVNRSNYNGNVIGLQAPGVPTPELDIPIRATSFARAVPPFGGFGNSFADGGLSLGLAFLSELQVQMFLEAAQGDTRTNVMQAPKVTAFNGASAQITVGDFQFFLTGVTVQAVGGQLLFTPNNVPFFIGSANPLPPNATVQNGVVNFQPTQTQTPGLLLFVQPVVTADRRFVRLNIRQEFVNLVSGTQQIPLTTIITPTFDNGGQGQPIPFTQYLQQPRFSNIATDTVVVVPDGGTVVMGGLKWMTEGRNEFGPPVLSKIPYLNRLFKNVAYGREGRTMLLMVTPRIIINREEQERQTGVRDDDNVGGLGLGGGF